MSEYLPFLVAGVATGSIYALAAMGLVVTYTTSGVFNFAQGAVGMLAAYLFYSLRTDAGVPAVVAVPLAVVGVGVTAGFLIDRVLLRRLPGASASTYVVVSLGLLVALQGFTDLVYGSTPRPIDSFLPTTTFQLPGVRVGWDQLTVTVVAAAAGIGLSAFFSRTRLGLRTRAVVDDGELTELVGVESARVTTFAWILACSFASLSAVLLTPFIGLDATILTLLIVQAFGAAAVGRLTSLPLTYAGGIAIGLAAALATKLSAEHPAIIGLPPSIPFLVLFGVLVLSPRGRFVEVERQSRQDRRPVVRRRAVRWPIALAALGVLVALPTFLNSSRLLTATTTLAFVLLFASLGLLVGLSRQVSCCHAVFVALGATTLSRLADAGVPYLPALLLAGLALVPVGAVIAVPAIRLSGLFLALATLGFGILVQYLLFGTDIAFGEDGIAFIPRPELLGLSLRGDHALYYFVLAVVAAGVLLTEIVARTRLGRICRAMADSPRAVESLGVGVTSARVLVFCVSAFLAAVAGGLLGTMVESVNSNSFGFFDSLLWLTVLVTAGSATLGGAALAAVLLVAVPGVVTAAAVTDYQPLIFGLLAIVLAQAANGLVGLWRAPDWNRLSTRWAWRLERSPRRRVAEVAR